MMDGVFDGSGNLWAYGVDAMYLGSAYPATWKLIMITKSNGNVSWLNELYMTSNTETTVEGSCVITADYTYIYCIVGFSSDYPLINQYFA